MSSVALWLALGIGCSPTLVDLARHWLSAPWALAFAVFVPWWLASLGGDARRAPPRALGLALVVAGVLLAGFAAAGGSARLGRYGVPAAILGLALWLGRPTPARALIALFWIPVPYAVQTGLFQRLTALLAPLTGGALPGRTTLALGPEDLGVQLCWLLAGLGWVASARRGAGVGPAAGAALRAGLLGIPLQGLALGVAAALAALGAAGPGRIGLDALVPAVAVLGSLALLARGRGARLATPRLADGRSAP